MAVPSVDSKAYIMGPADVYYRAVGVSTPWTHLGPTFEDAVARVNTVWRHPDIQGVMGQVQGLHTLLRVDAEVEFTIAEIDATRAALALPGARTTAEVHADSGGSPGSSTTTAAVTAGARTIPFTAVTNFSVGDYFRIEAAANAKVEYRVITAISSLNVSFRDPLIFAHDSGVAVVETTGDGRALIQAPIVRRQPDTSYNEWALVMESGKAAMHEIRLPRAIARQDSVELTIGEETDTGMRITLGASYSGSDLTISPFNIYVPTI